MTFLALSSLGEGLVILSELSATVMIGGVLIINVLENFTSHFFDQIFHRPLLLKICYLIVLIVAEFAFIEKVVVALTETARLTKIPHTSLF